MELHDETQVLEFEDSDITEGEGTSFNKKKVAHLKVFSQQGLKESLFPIFEGDNFIGRQKCEVNIPVKALSKKHACIEVHGDLHLIHDCESKNKTRKAKAFLKPLVRYELKHGDMLTVADIRCQYLVGDDLAEEVTDESGSETGSESMFPTDVLKDQELNLDQRIVCADSGNKPLSDKSGDVPSDDLKPTQNYLHSKQDKDKLAEAYAADTESDTDEGTPPRQAPKTTVVCDSDDDSSVVVKGALAESTPLQQTEGNGHRLSEDIRPVVPALLYSSDEEMPNSSDMNPQVDSLDKQTTTNKFKAPEPTLICESDNEKPEVTFKFRRPMGYDSSTDEESLLVVKPKFIPFSDASGDERALQHGPATPAHSSSSRDSRRSSMGLAPTLILSPESEESSSYSHAPWLASDAAGEEGPRESPPASPRERPAQGDQKQQEGEDKIEGEAETVAAEEPTVDPEATQAYAVSADEETDDEDQDHNKNQTADTEEEHRSAANPQGPSSEEQAHAAGDTNDDDNTAPYDLEATQAYSADATSDDDSDADAAEKVSIPGTESFEVSRNANSNGRQQTLIINPEQETPAGRVGDETDDESDAENSPSVLPEEQELEADVPKMAADLEATQAYGHYSDRLSPVLEQDKSGTEEEMHIEDQPTVAYGLDETQAYGADGSTSSPPVQLAGGTEESDPCEATQAYGIDETILTDEEQETDDEEVRESSESKEHQAEFVAETQDLHSPLKEPSNKNNMEKETRGFQAGREMEEVDGSDSKSPEEGKETTASLSGVASGPLSPVIPVTSIYQSGEDSEEESIGRRPTRKTRRKPLIVESQDDGSQPENQVKEAVLETPMVVGETPAASKRNGKKRQAAEEFVVEETPSGIGVRGKKSKATEKSAVEKTPTVSGREGKRHQVTEDPVVEETPVVSEKRGKKSKATEESAVDKTPTVRGRKGKRNKATKEPAVEETPTVSARKGKKHQVSEEPAVEETPTVYGRKGKRNKTTEDAVVEETPAVLGRKGKKHQATVGAVAVAESPGLVEDLVTDSPVETPATGRPRRGGRGKKVQITPLPGTDPKPSSESQTRQGRGRKMRKSAEVQAPGTAETGSSIDVNPQAKVDALRGENSRVEETATLEAEPSASSQAKRGRSKKKPWVEDSQEKTEEVQDVSESQTRKTRGKGKQVIKIKTPSMVDSQPGSEASESTENVKISEEDTAPSPGNSRQKGRGKRSRPTIEGSSSETPESSEEPPVLESNLQGTSEQKGRARRGKATKSDDSQGVIQATPVKRSRNPAASVESPSLSKETSEVENKPSVMFTGLESKQSEKIVKSLGGVLVDSVYDCTHLVTDKVRRTVKFLCGLGGGQKIVQPAWLDACKKAKAFVDSSPFLVKDKAAEKQFDFSLQRSHELAREKGLLDGYKVHVTKNVKPEPTQMKDIIKCAKGQFLSTLPKTSDEGVIVISCEQDRTLCRRAITAGIPVCSAELLLSGILKQELNIEEHQLFADKTEDSQESQGGRGKRKRGEAASGPAALNASAAKTMKRKRK